MAKHKRSGGFKAFGLSLPKLSTLKSSVSGMDALMGAGVGIVGIIGYNYLLKKLTAPKADGTVGTVDPAKLPTWLPKVAPLLGTALFGALAYALYRKKNAHKATGWLIGSVGAGVFATGLQYVQGMDWVKKNATLADYGFGALQREGAGRRYGALVADTRTGLNQLAAMSMGDASAAEELDALLG